jgi:hypothetical protein
MPSRSDAQPLRASEQTFQSLETENNMHVRVRNLRVIVPLIALVAFALLAAGCSGQQADASSIGVNAVAADPMAYSGEITMKGIVQMVDAENSYINVIDETEYETCGLTPCGSAGIIPLFLPVDGDPTAAGSLYDGQLPALEDAVLITGQVKDTGDGLMFDVTRIDRGSQTVIQKRR